MSRCLMKITFLLIAFLFSTAAYALAAEIPANGQLLWWLEGYNISGFTNAKPNAPWGAYIGEATTADLGIDFWMCLRKADGTVGWAHPKDYPKGTFNSYWK